MPHYSTTGSFSLAITELHHVNLRVPYDLLLQLRDFYRDVVGLSEGTRPPFNSRGFWLYAGGHPILHLSEQTDAQSGASVPGSAVDHVAFGCDDVDAVIQRLSQRQLAYTEREVPLLRQRQLFFTDPAGVGVELTFMAATPDSAA